MSSRPASTCAVALAVALLVFLQLPGPATCPNLAWRFVGLALDGLDADPSEELHDETPADVDAIVPRRPSVPHSAGHSAAVPAAAPLHAGAGAVVDSSVTRAPPAA